ncbi:YbaB/EbfC family nucleoid-associated protein [Micromonospora chalcea]
MSADPSMSGDFTRMLDATMAALRTVGPPPADEPETPAVGEAADGQVRAEMGRDGKLHALHVEPRLMRLGSEELTAHIVSAVNAAIEGLRTGENPQVADMSQLREQLQEVRDTAVPRLGSFLDALTEAQERMARGGQR